MSKPDVASKSGLKKITLTYVKKLQAYIDYPWYPPLVGFLAALDNFIVVIPNDGILISSSMLTPKRWKKLAFFDALGSTVGAILLALAIQHWGISLVDQIFPGLMNSEMWMKTNEFFQIYGLWILFLVAITPFVQQPAVILSVTAGFSIFEIATIIFIGRFIKYLIMAYMGAYAPQLLSKAWGLEDELAEVGIDIRLHSKKSQKETN